MRFKKLLIVITIIFFSANICSVLAYEMSSENYKLQMDEIDMGAVGDMRDFSDVSQNQGFLSGNSLKEVFASHFSWKMALIFLVGLLIISFIFYLIIKKVFIFKR